MDRKRGGLRRPHDGAAEPDGLDAGQGAQPRGEVVEEGGDLRILRVPRTGQFHTQREDAARIESQVHLVHRDEAADEQTRADHQDERHGDLGDRERGAQAPAARALRLGASTFLQELTGRGRRTLQRGRGAEDQARDERCQRRVEDHGGVDADAGQPRQVGWRQRRQRLDAPGCQQQSSRAAHGRKHEAFRQQLCDQPAPSGAQGRANRQFPLPGGGPREQEVGNVRAGDEEDEHRRPEQDQQRLPDIADDLLVHRHEPHADAGVGVRILTLEGRGNHVHFALRGAAVDRWLQPADDLQPVRGA